MASSYVNTGRQVVEDYLDYQNQKSHRDQNDDNDNHDDNDHRNKYNNSNNNDRNHDENQGRRQQNQQMPKLQQQPNRGNVNRQNNNSNVENGTYNGFMRYQDNGGANYNTNSGSQKSLSLEYGKSIKLLRNGDEFYRGQKYVINSRKYRYFDVFLDDISDKMNAQFGAVRNIHTPINGHRIRSLDEMEDGKTYVAAGSGRFVRLNYLDISEGKRPPPNRLPALQRPDYNLIQIPQYDKTQNLIVFIYRNGDIISPPVKILLHKNTLSSYDAVLNEITAKAPLSNGAVLKLYTMDGEQIMSPTQLQTGTFYVAGNKERFKRCDYQSAVNGSPRTQRKPVIFKSHSDDDSNNAAATARRLKPLNSHPVSSNQTSGKSNSYHAGKLYTGWHKDVQLPPVNGTKQNNNNSYHNNPNNSNTRKQEPKKLNVDKDESGIYKARTNNHDNVKTIEDNHNMYIDVPVDFRKPRQVEDEEFKHDNAQKNQLSKPNSKPPPQYQQQLEQHQNKPKANDNHETERNKKSNDYNPISPIPSTRKNDLDNKKEAYRSTDEQHKKSINKNELNQDKDEQDEEKNTKIARKKSITDDEAATRIQSYYRGYKTRLDLNNKVKFNIS